MHNPGILRTIIGLSSPRNVDITFSSKLLMMNTN
jgi:hypothetical protein